MKANSLRFIAKTADVNIQKPERNYGIFSFSEDCIYAINSGSLLKFHYEFNESNDEKEVSLAHPKILMAISEHIDETFAYEKRLGNNPSAVASIDNNSIHYGGSCFSLSNSEDEDLCYPDFEPVLNLVRGEGYTSIEVELWRLSFEIHQRNIVFNEKYLIPLFDYFEKSYPCKEKMSVGKTTLWLHTGGVNQPFMIECREDDETVFEYLIMAMVD